MPGLEQEQFNDFFHPKENGNLDKSRHAKMVSDLTHHDFIKNGPIRTDHSRLFNSLIAQSDKEKYFDYYFHDYYNKIIFNEVLILKFWFNELETQTNFFSLKQLSLADFFRNGLKAFENIYGTTHPLLYHFMGYYFDRYDEEVIETEDEFGMAAAKEKLKKFRDRAFALYYSSDSIYKKYSQLIEHLQYKNELSTFEIQDNYVRAIIVFVLSYVIEESQKYEVVLEDNTYVLKKKEATGNLSRFIISTLGNLPEQKIHISKLLHLINRSDYTFEIPKPVTKEWLVKALNENPLKYYYSFDEKREDIIKSFDINKFYRFLIDNSTNAPSAMNEKPNEDLLYVYNFIGETFPLEIADQYVRIRPIFWISVFNGKMQENNEIAKNNQLPISRLFEMMLKDHSQFEKAQIDVGEFIKDNVRIGLFPLADLTQYFADRLEIDSVELSLSDIKEFLIINKQPVFNSEMPEYNLYYADLEKYLFFI